MVLRSLPLAIAPSALPAGRLGFSACLFEGYGFARVDSVQGSGAVTCGRCPRYSVQGWQVAKIGIGYLVCTHYYAQVLKKKREEEQPSH
jgi:hypothetical protein